MDHQHRVNRQKAEREWRKLVTITHLRAAFRSHGFDVDAWQDDEVSKAVIGAGRNVSSTRELFCHAFALLSAAPGTRLSPRLC